MAEAVEKGLGTERQNQVCGLVLHPQMKNMYWVTLNRDSVI